MIKHLPQQQHQHARSSVISDHQHVVLLNTGITQPPAMLDRNCAAYVFTILATIKAALKGLSLENDKNLAIANRLRVSIC